MASHQRRAGGPSALIELLAEISQLRDMVRNESATILAAWQPALASLPAGQAALPAMRNLAEYLALRQTDIGALQTALARHGLSSLGRSEGHVMASLDALYATLARLTGADNPPYPTPAQFEEGHHALTEGRRLFGASPGGPPTRVMVTLPSEAAQDDGTLIRQLVEAGMTCARINCAHDSPEAWRTMAAHVRAASRKGRDCRILMDIGGPKCRIETVHAADRVRLFEGDRLVIVRALQDARASDAVIATISFPALLERLAAGAEVWINDGRIGTRVAEPGAARVVLEVTAARPKGERLKPEKGVNFPGTELNLSPLTDKDLADLDVVAEEADLVGFSFVQHTADIRRLHAELSRRRAGRPALPLVLKIETRLAVRNLPRLIVQAGAYGPVAVMIARGDLAVELGFARLSEMQEEIMWLCEAARVPVVWATQVLDALVSDGLPTRAEATDAAAAQRAECVMLNKGPHVVEAVRFLTDVLRRMERHQEKKSPRFGPLHSWPAAQLAL